MTFAIATLIHATECCPIEACKDFADNNGGRALFLDLALLVSAVVLTVLCATHVIPLSPAGTYSFAGLGGVILIADLFAFGAFVMAIVKRKKDQKSNHNPKTN